jgi:hypothetical protein
MAKPASKPRKSSPPAVGETFAMRLADGRYGACRVLREPGAHEPHAAGRVVAGATNYIGDAPPSIDHPDLRRLLVLNNHHFKNQTHCMWVDGQPPADTFTRIGNIEPADAERRISCNSWGAWDGFAVELLMEWRWDHDRDAVLAEDAAYRRETDQRRAELEQQSRDELARMTYASFRKQKLFKNWDDYPPKKMIAASRKVMKETATKLESLGPTPYRDQARAILRDCILAFNRLDEENDHWIETIEREDIAEHFYQLATLAGLADEPELADEWRDW